jgi:hypothetical protein
VSQFLQEYRRKVRELHWKKYAPLESENICLEMVCKLFKYLKIKRNISEGGSLWNAICLVNKLNKRTDILYFSISTLCTDFDWYTLIDKSVIVAINITNIIINIESKFFWIWSSFYVKYETRLTRKGDNSHTTQVNPYSGTFNCPFTNLILHEVTRVRYF